MPPESVLLFLFFKQPTTHVDLTTYVLTTTGTFWKLNLVKFRTTFNVTQAQKKITFFCLRQANITFVEYQCVLSFIFIQRFEKIPNWNINFLTSPNCYDMHTVMYKNTCLNSNCVEYRNTCLWNESNHLQIGLHKI